jgi:hypothetical protein
MVICLAEADSLGVGKFCLDEQNEAARLGRRNLFGVICVCRQVNELATYRLESKAPNLP